MKLIKLRAKYITELPITRAIDLSSTIRGVWGRGLRRAYCLQRNIGCKDCPFESCTYYSVFEKQYGEFESFHPYIIHALESDSNTISVIFKFIGWVCDNPGQLILSILKTDGAFIMSRGQRIPIKLISIHGQEGLRLFSQGDDRIISPIPRILSFSPQEADTVSLDFLTPLRVKHKGHLLSHFLWQPFFRSLASRIRFLDQYFNYGDLRLPPLEDASEPQILSSTMIWQERFRKSFRQDSKMTVGGLTGKVELGGLDPDTIGFLKLGSFLHSGKQCSFGNGYFRLDTR